MSYNKFFEELDFNKNSTNIEFKYKILVWPNITYVDDLERDSYVIVLYHIIRVLSSLRNDIHWTVITPKPIALFKSFINVEQIMYDLPSYPNGMRAHFDTFKVYNILGGTDKEFDIIYSHLPEHTLQLSNIVHNQSNIKPDIIGYCHWYEINENTEYLKNMFNLNILGTLEMLGCGVNSMWLKNLIIEKARIVFNDDIISKLHNILKPHYLGTDSDFSDSQEPSIKNSIIFNHRPNEYTGWNSFLKLMDVLWEKRKDFKVYVTLAEEENRPYIQKVKFLTRQEYFNFLKRIQIGVGMFKTYSAWSLSTTDGLSRGVPYLLPNRLCYPEMVGDNYSLFYSNDEQFLTKLEKSLDNENFRNEHRVELKKICNALSWESSISSWFDNWSIFDNLKQCTDKSEAYSRIYKFIKNKRITTKKEIIKYLGWGRSIGFSTYRNRLRNEKNIKFYKDRYEFID